MNPQGVPRLAIGDTLTQHISFDRPNVRNLVAWGNGSETKFLTEIDSIREYYIMFQVKFSGIVRKEWMYLDDLRGTLVLKKYLDESGLVLSLVDEKEDGDEAGSGPALVLESIVDHQLYFRVKWKHSDDCQLIQDYDDLRHSDAFEKFQAERRILFDKFSPSPRLPKSVPSGEDENDEPVSNRPKLALTEEEEDVAYAA